MKNIKKHLQTINEAPIKKWASLLIILFFMMTILFQKDVPNTEFQFVRNGDTALVHNAAQQRDYLFVDEWWINNSTGTTINTGNMTIDSLINPSEIQQIIADTQTGNTYTWTLFIWSMNTWSMNTWVITTWIQIKELTGVINTWSLDCITPRKEEVKNKDFILAYEQRKDVNTICNIEKRICTDGVLWWSFAQSSCKEDVVYDYRKAQVISYNQKVINEYIQPSDPINSWADFSTQGKINIIEKPIDKRGTSNNPIITKKEVTESPLPSKANCITPRGQTIKHGQFTKWYKAPRGFIDLACDVEIRACVNGNLKGTFNYPKCTFNNTSYTDYLKAGSPTASTGFLFFQRIKSTLKFWR